MTRDLLNSSPRRLERLIKGVGLASTVLRPHVAAEPVRGLERSRRGIST